MRISFHFFSFDSNYAFSEFSLIEIMTTIAPDKTQLNRYSATLTQEVSNPAAQAMLYGIGLTEDDMKKPQIGIASAGYDGNPCNIHLNGLAAYVKKGVNESGLVGLVFNTIGVSDGMTN